jgi:splicing factor 3B subunit 1
VGQIEEDLTEPYRKMVIETIKKVVNQLGTTYIDTRLEKVLTDDILYAFQEQTVVEDTAR